MSRAARQIGASAALGALVALGAPLAHADDPIVPVPSASTHLSVEAPAPPPPSNPPSTRSAVPSAQTYGTGVPARTSSNAPTTSPVTPSSTSEAVQTDDGDDVGGGITLSTTTLLLIVLALVVCVFIPVTLISSHRGRVAERRLHEHDEWPDAWREVDPSEYSDDESDDADDDDTQPLPVARPRARLRGRYRHRR